MVTIIKLLVSIIKLLIMFDKFGVLDEVVSKLQDLIPTEAAPEAAE